MQTFTRFYGKVACLGAISDFSTSLRFLFYELISRFQILISVISPRAYEISPSVGPLGFESTRVKYKYMQSLPGYRPWLLTAINRVSGQGRCPGRLCHGVSGQGRHPGRLCHGVSGQGRCPGRQLGLGFVLAFRVEKQNIGSSRNRNPVGAVYSN